MADEFKPGDTVKIKSGGPIMTVDWAGPDSLTNDPTVVCVWIVDGKKTTDKFPPHTLEHVRRKD